MELDLVDGLTSYVVAEARTVHRSLLGNLLQFYQNGHSLTLFALLWCI
jgi:hypothetical protein